MTAEAFIYDAVRTPRGKGKKTGALHSVKPISLTTGLIDEVRSATPASTRRRSTTSSSASSRRSASRAR